MDLTQLNDYTTRSEAVCRRNDTISPRLYEEYGVKKGLRDENGNGVLAGLTNISKNHVLQNCGRQKDSLRRPTLVPGLPGGRPDRQPWGNGAWLRKDRLSSAHGTDADSAAAEEFRRLLGELQDAPHQLHPGRHQKPPARTSELMHPGHSDAGVLRRARHRHQRQQFPPAVHPADRRIPAAGRLRIPCLQLL